jgi:hypothetical protein
VSQDARVIPESGSDFMAYVFISYSRKDKGFVRRLDDALKSREREAWVDWEGIRPTEEFLQAIYGATEASQLLIAIGHSSDFIHRFG